MNNKTRKNNHTTSIIRVAQALVITLLCIASVSALGIMPSGRVFDYQEGRVVTIPLTVINSAQEHDFSVRLGAQGALAQHISFSTTLVTIPAGSTEVNATAILTIPTLSTPGVHEALITVQELPGEDVTEGGVSTIITVTSRIRVRVPYPDTYLETALFAQVREDYTNIVVSASNRGTSDVREAHANIVISSPEGLLVTQLSTPTTSIRSSENVKLTTTWNNHQKGTYVASAHTLYDDQQAVATTSFDVGAEKVILQEVNLSWAAGKIIITEVVIANDWNTRVKDVYSEVIIKDESSLLTITSFTEELIVGQARTFTGYEQATNVLPGAYNVTIRAYFEGGMVSQDAFVLITEDSITILEEYEEPAEQEDPQKGKWFVYALIAVLVIILNLAIMFVHKKHNDNEEEKKTL